MSSTTYTLAKHIVQKLNIAGYVAYFAGGWVRDYLLEHPSEDIDIATNAPPEKILDLFPHTLLIGLTFGIVVVVIDGHQFEVATFRRDIDYKNGRKPEAIALASAEQDALRRDFTINGMFYDPIEECIYDYVHGQQDLKHKVIRTIGDPYERFSEDRLRMIRAFRFAARFGFAIDIETQEAIRANALTLFPAVAMERVWSEWVKMSKHTQFANALIDMHRLELLPVIFPALQGAHLKEIKHRVATFPFFPKETPPIWFLLELIPEMTQNSLKELTVYLRTSKSELELGLFLMHVRECIVKENKGEIDLPVWTHLYAHPKAETALQVASLALPLEKRAAFIHHHQNRIGALHTHIQRIIEKKPLITGHLLQSEGVSPGKLMGLLLKEAERLAIVNDCNESDLLMKQLKNSPLWGLSQEE